MAISKLIKNTSGAGLTLNGSVFAIAEVITLNESEWLEWNPDENDDVDASITATDIEVGDGTSYLTGDTARDWLRRRADSSDVRKSVLLATISLTTPSTTSTSYVVMGTFLFSGTDNLEVPTKFNAFVKTTGSTGWYRIYDVTNSLTVAEVSFTNTTYLDISDTSLTNLPSGRASFELQLKATSTYTTSFESGALEWF